MRFEWNLLRVHTGRKDMVAFGLPPDLQAAFWSQIKQDEVESEREPVYYIQIKNKCRPRTTGKGSQNRHINGHVQQIAQETGRSFELVKMSAKFVAIENSDYPYEMAEVPNGGDEPIQITVPASEKDLNTVQAGYLIEALHVLAVEYGVQLIEKEQW